MKRLAVLLSVAALALIAAAGAQSKDVTVGHSGWNWGNPQPQGNSLRAVEFSGSRGFAAGEFGTLLRTDDRGRSWTGIATGTTEALDRIALPDEDTVVVGGGCELRRSDDAGATFKAIAFTDDCDNGLVAMSFPSSQVGYLVLDKGSVLRTEDGGATFAARGAVPGTPAALPEGATATPTDIFFT